MNVRDVVRAWGRVLAGRCPSLSIEITRECPLRCPGCYAYSEGHVGNGVNLRQLADKKNEALIEGVLDVVDQYRPLHLSIVGGDPLVRYRELEVLLPKLEKRGIHVQVVTSAFREIPAEWARIRRLSIVVSVDGLQPEHDARRKPATYERILRNIDGQRVTIHCTVTAQMMARPGYLREFLEFWTPRKEIRKVWMSLFTPQRGELLPEVLSVEQRSRVVEELMSLRKLYPKLEMPAALIREFLNPPLSPEECIFAQTTNILSADLKTKVVPCQFGGNPDCSQCGCIASMGLAAVGHKRLLPGITAGDVFRVSMKAGNAMEKMRVALTPRKATGLTQISVTNTVSPTEADAAVKPGARIESRAAVSNRHKYRALTR